MKAQRLLMSLTVLGCLAATPPAAAHRLDEYLQATRLSIDTDRVDVEMDLTAGIALASQVFHWIDTNGDGEISQAEGEAYARQVLGAAVLSVDDRPVPIALVECQFPPLSEMSLGTGIIRLRGTAKVPTARAGFHRASFLNTHHLESSVYLVNALVPASPRIRIGDQQRDYAQHRLTLDYNVTAEAPPAWSFVLLAGLGGIALAGRLVFAGRVRKCIGATATSRRAFRST